MIAGSLTRREKGRKEHGLLFCGEMIRAFLRPVNPKRQTRRIVSAGNSRIDGVSGRSLEGKLLWENLNLETAVATDDGKAFVVIGCRGGSVHRVTPLIQPGDGVWAKETWRYCETKIESLIQYHADQGLAELDELLDRRQVEWTEEVAHSILGRADEWRPSIFMRRWMSRIEGIIPEVRAQRVREISEADALAEGVTLHGSARHESVARNEYQALWNTLNLAPKKTPSSCPFGDGEDYIAFPWSVEDFEAKYPGVLKSGMYRGRPISVAPNPPVWAYTLEIADAGRVSRKDAKGAKRGGPND